VPRSSTSVFVSSEREVEPVEALKSDNTNVFLRDENAARPRDAPKTLLDAEDTAGQSRWVHGVKEVDNIAPYRIRILNVVMPDDGANPDHDIQTQVPETQHNGCDIASSPMCGNGDSTKDNSNATHYRVEWVEVAQISVRHDGG
jgi:hypothetical protein